MTDLSRVSVDNAGGMRELTEHLINSHGLRDLRFVGSIAAADRMERFAAFRATLRAAKLPVPRKPLAATVEYRSDSGGSASDGCRSDRPG